jgi:hypothetical protein
MSKKSFRVLGVFWLAGLVLLLQASAARGFGIFDSLAPTITFADLLANPTQFASWDPDTPGGNVITITYRFDSTFTTDERIRDQVRLGIQQWDQANITPYGTTYSYLRNTGSQDFYDVRSVTTHELGHNLGFAHPFQVSAVGRNYDFNPNPPPTLIAVPDRGDEVMGYGTVEGGYNQILSHDELNGYRYSYGSKDMNFVEITSGTPDILLSAQPMGGLILGYGPPSGVQRNPGDPTQGVRITSAEIVFGSDAIIPLGFRTLGQNWDVHNSSGTATRGFEVQTRGTNNLRPFEHFDGDPAGFHFDSYSVSSTGDPDHKDDLLHTWSDPRFWGSPVDIPAGALAHIGVEQDVWDWTVVSARAVHPDGTKTSLPLVAFSQWNEMVTGVDVTTSSGGIVIPDPPPEIIPRGIRIVNTEDTPAELGSVGVAVVDDMDLQLEDLNLDGLYQLMERGLFETLPIEPRTLAEGEELFLIFDQSPTGLGDTMAFDATSTGIDSAIFLDRPDLLGHELFVYADTRVGDLVVGNYALLGAPPITGMLVPEPSTLALAAVGLLGLLSSAWWRKNRRR